jgi:hypothetical protein
LPRDRRGLCEAEYNDIERREGTSVKTLGSIVAALLMLAAETVTAALIVLAPWRLYRLAIERRR